MRKVRIGVAAAAVAVLGVLGMVAPAAAHQEETGAGAHREDLKARAKGRLDEARRKVCTGRTGAIVAIMQKSGDAGQRHLNLFNDIKNRVTEFYAAKKLNVANYEALKSAAEAKYAAAAEAVKAVKEVKSFDCNGDNPVGLADGYKAKIAAMHIQLKDFRAAVHALLVAVKTAAAAEGGGQ